jgi:hypothetical protein
MTKIGRHRSKKPKFGFNRNVAKLRVSKLQIVQREIDTCADLYFSFGDLVSTHLLISAAHEILAAFDKKILKTGMLFDLDKNAFHRVQSWVETLGYHHRTAIGNH